VQFSWWDLPVVATFKPHRPARGFVQTIEQPQKEDLPAPLGSTTTRTPPVGMVTATFIDDANARDSPAKVFRFEYGFRWRKNRSLEVSKRLSLRR